jgi:hypothetical protein
MKELSEFEAQYYFRKLEEIIGMLKAARQAPLDEPPAPKRGRPRSIPQEGRATSNPWRDERKRKEAAAAVARLEARVQALSDTAQQTEEQLRDEQCRLLWATMDALCAPPMRADIYSDELLS